jgi:hypothetical protein
MTDMTRRDRDDLQKVVRLRTKLAKDGIAGREAELLAMVEDELGMSFRFDQDVIADITRQAEEAITAADAALAQRCRELSVREEFRPKLTISWYRRGRTPVPPGVPSCASWRRPESPRPGRRPRTQSRPGRVRSSPT